MVDVVEQAAAEAALVVGERSRVRCHDVAVVLGSGWSAAADRLGAADVDLSVTELPGFVPPRAAGHPGRVRSLDVDGRRTLLFVGRTHLYEGHGVDTVVHAVRTAAAAGCRVVVLANGCGSLRPDWAPGAVVLLRDHLNLTGCSPLVGARFVDLTDAYSARLRDIARQVDPSLSQGVYAQLLGPQYETPAEIAMLTRSGADLVGMSTAVETIAARAAGLDVLGLSLVTNLAAGLTPDPVLHADVLAAGQRSAERIGRLLRDLVPRL